MENESSENKEVAAAVETPVEESKPLSLRDALEVAIETHKSEPKEPTVEAKPEAPKAEEAPEIKPYDPPAEWSKEEKETWAKIPREAQEPILRLDKSRKARIDEIRQASNEYKQIKELADSITPYMRSQGIKDPADVAMKKAVAMWHEFEHGDPKQAARAYLQAKGVDPKELLVDSEEQNVIDEKLSAVQNSLNELKQEKVKEEQAKIAAVLNQTWGTFSGEEDAAGAPKYADIVGDSESALRLSGSIGSLVGGQTELSKQFIANCQSRFPDLTPVKLLEEAYKYYGGRIDETPATKTQDPQEHLKKSNRAAASVPGRGSSGLTSPSVKKFKTTREAAAHALAVLNGKTG